LAKHTFSNIFSPVLLYATLLVDGTDLGLERMVDATRDLSYHHLVNVAQWHVN
jgi:hypothetical protein